MDPRYALLSSEERAALEAWRATQQPKPNPATTPTLDVDAIRPGMSPELREAVRSRILELLREQNGGR